MKLLTLNFLTCAITNCKASAKSFPLHPREAELESVELDFSPIFLRNILPRIEWPAMQAICSELGLTLPASLAALAVTNDDTDMEGVESSGAVAGDGAVPFVANSTAASASEAVSDDDLKALHGIIIETQMVSGKLVCGNCGHEYAVKEGIANFLLPPHLV